MSTDVEPSPPAAATGRRMLAWLVHLFTASGVAFAFLAAFEVCRPEPEPRKVCLYLIIAVLIDALDGPWARRAQVVRYLPHVHGRTIDDIVDYLTFTFVPLLFIARLGWVLEPVGLFVVPAMMASLLGFANEDAKQERDGFFRGFPSYWNVFLFYAGPWAIHHGPLLPTVVIVGLTVLTLLPVRFLYPNLAPRPWRFWLLLGGYVWTIQLLLLLPGYPDLDPLWGALSLVYPAFYVVLSVVLDRKRRTFESE